MTTKLRTRTIRVPVRYIDGMWECEFGGGVPVKDGAAAELVIERQSISNRGFLQAMEAEALYSVLPEGTELQVMLHIKPDHHPADHLASCVASYSRSGIKVSSSILAKENTDTLHFVSVKIGKPTDRQARRLGTETGGLWLRTRGTKALGLITTRISLPDAVSLEPVSSLNHAFTKLSETYETWRISHTGNIYTNVLYKESSSLWYPLDFLRNRALVQQEHAIARGIWENFRNSIKQLNLGT